MVEISTSLLSVEKENIIKTIYNLETAKADYFHIDVMDGKFVKNNSVNKMIEFCDYLNNITNIPLDVHLMVIDVKKYIDLFLPYNPNIITIHYESFSSKDELIDTINYIKSNNIKVGVSIKPNTDISEIYNILKFVNLVLIMSVEPGEGGQKFIDSTFERINELYNYIKANKLDLLIEVDGGINLENVNKIKDFGVDIVVSGTCIINSENYTEIIQNMKMD